MSKRITRRQFVKGMGAAVTGAMFLPRLSRAKGANEKLNIANIGVGGMRGGAHLAPAAGENLVALCDIDDNILGAAAKRFPNAKPFNDYRRMLEQVKEIDAVMVATPDHHHYPASMLALTLGKHVFCEKPLTHSVWEARRLAQVAGEKKLATQLGNQGHSAEGNRRLCEYIWVGAIGPVTEVHAWTSHPGPVWQQGLTRPKDTPPVPGHVHWDEWLGPAPDRPYHPAYMPVKWRGWMDFGTGALGDQGCHVLDGPVWALKLGQADKITVGAESFGMTDDSYPKWSIVTYQFSAREGMGPCKLVWYEDGKKPPRPAELEEGRSLEEHGCYIVGEKGIIVSGQYGGCRIIPEPKHREFKPPPVSIPRSAGMHADWLAACKGGPAASSNFEVAGRLTEIALLGNVAVRCGARIEYDLSTGKITNNPDAEKLLKREYRKGWDF